MSAYAAQYLNLLNQLADQQSQRLRDVASARAAAQMASAQAWGNLPLQLTAIGNQAFDNYQGQKRLDLQEQRYNQMAEMQDEQNRIAAQRQAEIERKNAETERMAAQENRRKAALETAQKVLPGMVGDLNEAKTSRENYQRLLPRIRGMSRTMTEATGGLFPDIPYPDEPDADTFSMLDQLSAVIKAQMGGGDVVSVSPGGALVQKGTGAVVYQAPFAPPRETPPQIGTAGDYVSRYAASLGKTPDKLTPGEYDAALRQYRDNTQRPPAEPKPQTPNFVVKEVMDAAGNLRVANYDSTTGKYYDVNTNDVIVVSGEAKPTADIRNAREKVRGLVPQINSMRTLASGLITTDGPKQRLSALWRKGKALVGKDDAFKAYEDFRAGLAVAISVAQQGSRPSDADVFRAAMPLVPDPYSDTAGSAKRKWDQIEEMFRNRLSKEGRAELGIGPVVAPSKMAAPGGPKIGDTKQSPYGVLTFDGKMFR